MDMQRKSGLLKLIVFIAVVLVVDLSGFICSRYSTNGEKTYSVPVISVSGDEYGEDKDIPTYKQKVTVEYEEKPVELDWESEDCMHLYKEGDTLLIKKDKYKDDGRMKIVNTLQGHAILWLMHMVALLSILVVVSVIEPDSILFWVCSCCIIIIALYLFIVYYFVPGIL